MADALKTFAVTIEGKTPLLCNRFTDDRGFSSTSGTSSSLTGDKGTPQEQAEARLYRGEDHVIMIPGPNLFRCIIDAGKYFKVGRSKVTTQKTSLIPACLSLDEITIPIQHEQPWTVDTRPVRIPSTGGRILCHRPRFDDWRLSFELELDTEMIGVKLLRDLVDAGGKRIGLGDFRPDCKGPFGKFVVIAWNEQRAA